LRHFPAQRGRGFAFVLFLAAASSVVLSFTNEFCYRPLQTIDLDVFDLHRIAPRSTLSQSEQPPKQPPLPPFGVIVKYSGMGCGTMANGKVKKPKAIKGIFERPDGSGIWWINYYIEGKRFREKVGRRSDAVTLYQRRKTDARMGVKMPEVRARRAVLFEEIAADALVYSQEHKASYPGDRSTVGKLLPTFGKIPLDNITPQTIKAYLDKRDDLTKTTINRYRGTISMIFQEAIRNGKATANPARLVRLHREDNSRVRFVTFAEEATIRGIIRERCPTHEPEMTLALETGMRRGEQYSLEWDRVDVQRRQLLLLKTKNGTARVVILTTAAVAALEELRERRDQLKIKKEMERALVLTTGSSVALEEQQSQTST
jgi:site-specific recombinase XerD